MHRPGRFLVDAVPLQGALSLGEYASLLQLMLTFFVKCANVVTSTFLFATSSVTKTSYLAHLHQTKAAPTAPQPPHPPMTQTQPPDTPSPQAHEASLHRQATKEGAPEILSTPDPDSYPLQSHHQSHWRAWGLTKSYLNDEIDHASAALPLAWQAFLTGMVDMLLYSRSAVWLGFQTGNMVQFSSNIAQFIIPGAETQPLLTLLRILSVIGFFIGSFTGFQLGRRVGHSKRSWLIISSMIQSAFLFGAAGILLSRPPDELPTFEWYPGVIVLVAFSMGMQSILAQKLVSPAFATTVAFTATLTQIASDPYLFHLVPSEKTRGRDRRMFAILALCVGAGVGESLLHTRANLGGGLAICAGFKVVLALLWLVPTGKEAGPAKVDKA